jgi:YD repeat-containing protein
VSFREKTAFAVNAPARSAMEAGTALAIGQTDDELMRVGLFAQPLIPVGMTNPEENRELAYLLADYRGATGRGELDAVQPFVQFLNEHPDSAWKTSLQVDLGAVYRRTGHFSKALESWQAAWDGSKDFTDRTGRAVADIAVGYLSQLEANYGRKDALSALLDVVKRRPVRGSATELVSESATGLAEMREHPEISFKCGPFALLRILALNPEPASFDGLHVLQRSHSTAEGLSLTAVQDLSVQAGMNYQMAYRSPGASMILPAVVHWRVDHYAALLGEYQAGRFLVGDPTFGEDIVVSSSTLEQEASGYYLVPSGPLPKGWRTVDASEGGKVWGRGDTGNNRDDGATGPDEPRAFTCPDGGGGCATWNVEAMVTGLTLHDDPVGYNPPIGPPIHASVTYSHRDALQPAVMPYANFGNKWSSDWVSYIDVNGGCGSPGDQVVGGFYANGETVVAVGGGPGGGGGGGGGSAGGSSHAEVVAMHICDLVHRRGGGSEPYTYPNESAPITQTSYEGQFSHSILTRNISKGIVTSIVRTLPDGSSETFSFNPAGNNLCSLTGVPCQLFMTEVDDQQGNKVTISYDSTTRIVTLTDAIGQVTTFCYDDSWQTKPSLCKQPQAGAAPPSNLQITQVTDPFGRSAFFGYDPSTGQLTSITDVLGITSSFVYQTNSDGSKSDFIKSLTTPYGTTQFQYGDANTDQTLGSTPYVLITDPLGRISRVGFHQTTDDCDASTGYNTSIAGLPVICTEKNVPSAPGVLNIINQWLQYRNTFVWNAQQYAVSYNTPNRYLGAKVIHWLHADNTVVYTCSRIPESVKEPLESRIWFNYLGQVHNDFDSPFAVGATNQPTVIARLLDDGTTQVWQYQYNGNENVTQVTDPLGRQLTMTYDTNGVDLLTITNTTTSGGKQYSDSLLTLSNYTQHEPEKIVAVNGQATTLAYNAVGQVISRTDPLGNNWTRTYNSSGYLTQIKGPSTPQTLEYNFSYDSFGRVSSLTDPSGESVFYSYDPADRLTRTLFPDQTSEAVGYTLLDLTSTTDRRGNTTQRKFDADRELIEIDEPGGRTTSLAYWPNRVVRSILDPRKFQTTFFLDVQGRISQATAANNISKTYAYDGAGRLISEGWTAPSGTKGAIVSYTYNVDNTISAIAPAWGASTTAYQYDPAYPRLTNWSQPSASETYTYNPVTAPPGLGANRLQAVSTEGPGINPIATRTYSYDELDRIVGRRIEIAPLVSSETWKYDALGRLTSRSDDLDTFNYAYADATSRVSAINSADGLGLSIAATYYPPTGDGLMQTLTYQDAVGPYLRSFPVASYSYQYDANHNVTSFTESYPERAGSAASYAYDAHDQLVSVTGPGAVFGVGQTTYGYDLAGNLVSTASSGMLPLNILNFTSAINIGAVSNNVSGSLANATNNVGLLSNEYPLSNGSAVNVRMAANSALGSPPSVTSGGTITNNLGIGLPLGFRSQSTSTSYDAANQILTTNTVTWIGNTETSVTGSETYGPTGALLGLGAPPRRQPGPSISTTRWIVLSA